MKGKFLQILTEVIKQKKFPIEQHIECASLTTT